MTTEDKDRIDIVSDDEGERLLALPGSKARAYSKAMDDVAYKYCLLHNPTDKDLAAFLGIAVNTIRKWKDKHISFRNALMKGRFEVDAQIAEALAKRAMGYSHPEAIVYQGVVMGEVTKHYPPDTTAAVKWLGVRRAKPWRDVAQTEITGKSFSLVIKE